jgi:hypothetical protein
MSVPAHTERPQSKTRRATRSDRAWRWAAVILAGLVSSIGCQQPISTLAWLTAPDGNSMPPKLCSLSIKDKETKVLILAAHEDPVGMNLAFQSAPRDLSRKLGQLLEQRYKEGGDKVKVISLSKVFSYMDEHSEWIMESKRDLGKHFGADFVIFMELGKMTLYETGSHNGLYRGKAGIRLSVYDVSQEDGDELIKEEVYNCEYPKAGPEDASAMPPAHFHMKFLDQITRDLAEYFAPFPSDETMGAN